MEDSETVRKGTDEGEALIGGNGSKIMVLMMLYAIGDGDDDIENYQWMWWKDLPLDFDMLTNTG